MSSYLQQRFKFFDNFIMQTRESAVFMSLLELGIFSALAPKPLVASQLAEKCGCSEKRLGRFLDFASCLGMLDKRGEEYALVPGDEGIFAEEKMANRLILSAHKQRFIKLSEIVEILREDKPLVSAGSGGKASDEERRSFLTFLDTRSGPAAKQTAQALCKEKFKKFADLGCGAGTYSFAMLKENEESSGVLVDRENAEHLINELAEKYDLSNRIHFVGGDLFSLDYGDDFDLIFMSNLVHCFSSEDNTRLIKDAAKRLRLGGRLVIKDFLVHDERKSPKEALSFATLMATVTEDGDVYSLSEIEPWCAEAGLVYEGCHLISASPEAVIYVFRRPER